MPGVPDGIWKWIRETTVEELVPRCLASDSQPPDLPQLPESPISTSPFPPSPAAPVVADLPAVLTASGSTRKSSSSARKQLVVLPLPSFSQDTQFSS